MEKEKKEDIIPNTVYIINKLNFATQANVLVKICGTLKYYEREQIDPDKFMEYVIQKLAFGRCVILVSFNEKTELNGCAVLFLNNNPVKGKILWIEWIWTDSKNFSLSKKGLEVIEDLAQKLGADRIAGAMTKNFNAVCKKYGFREAYRVMEKEVKKNEENMEKN